MCDNIFAFLAGNICVASKKKSHVPGEKMSKKAISANVENPFEKVGKKSSGG